MRLRLFVDGYPLEICTRDPELLARWLVEIFAGIDWTPATQVEVQAHPLFWPPRNDRPGPMEPDWITRSEVISRIQHVGTPREVAEALLGEVRRLENFEDAEHAQALAELDPP